MRTTRSDLQPQRSARQAGFTLPELLAVIGVLVVALVLAALLLRPKSYEFEEVTAERRLRAAALVQALARYHEDNKAWPAGIAATAKNVGNDKNEAAICVDLVPRYLADLPYDPLTGFKMDKAKQQFVEDACTEDVLYDTGFSVKLDGPGRLVLKAPAIGPYPALTITR